MRFPRLLAVGTPAHLPRTMPSHHLDVALGDDALAPLRALLQLEAHPLHARGRAYVARLARRRGAPLAQQAAATKESESSDVRRRSAPSFDATSLERDPRVLLLWRRCIGAWFQDFCDRFDYEFDTASAALSYLDAYATRACFPEELNQAAENTCHEDFVVVPPPPKKRKSSTHQCEDEPLDSAGDGGQNHEEGSFRGLDKSKYQFSAFASLYLACKIYQSPFSSREFSKSCRGTFSPDEIEAMELEVLQALRFRVHPPTEARFVRELLPLLLSGDGDASYWVPRDDVEQRIVAGADAAVRRAALVAREERPPLLSAAPSQLALAAVVHAASEVFYEDKLLVRQHNFHSRLFALEAGDLMYGGEVVAVQRCLEDLKKQPFVHRREFRCGSPAAVSESITEAAREPSSSLHASEDVKSLKTRLDEPGTSAAEVTKETAASSCIEGEKDLRASMSGKPDEGALPVAAGRRATIREGRPVLRWRKWQSGVGGR